MHPTKIQLIFGPPKIPARLGELGEKINPPLGILYLAAYLRDKVCNIEIDIVDGARHGYDYTLRRIRDFRPDILGVSFYTTTALSCYSLINQMKDEDRSMFIIAGGPHVTALPQELLCRSKADVGVIGEGEESLLELVSLFIEKGKRLSQMEFKRIDGIIYREGEYHVVTRKRTLIKNPDSIPFPARDLINMQEYSGWYLYKRLPETKMIMSRGCPYNCTFCSNPVWKTSKPWLRLRSPKNIVDEIEEIMARHGIREFMDDGDEFNNVVKNAMGICEELKRRRLDIPWKTQLHVHSLPEELVRAMAKAGCWYVHLGIESGNEQTLKGIRKNITQEEVIRACKLLQKYNIEVMGLFMIYNVWEEGGQLRFEDTEASKRTLDFANVLLDKALLNHLNWSITTPYPGSELYNIAIKYNLIKAKLHENWDSWIKENSFVMKLPGVPEKEQARMKTYGMTKKAWRILRSGNISIKDFGLFIKKALKLGQNEFRAWLKERNR
jgi:radical SAM superfamily enzyme YgiQ (UPF0313 family)